MYYDLDGYPISKAEGQRLLARRKALVTEKVGCVTIVTMHTVIGLQCSCGCMKGIYETKILGGKRDGDIRRHHSMGKAIDCHRTMAALERIL